jgi:pyrroloquinoline quinone (PQQ) biosynthesis protein C
MQHAIESLTKGLERHPALDNGFYRAWMGGPLDLPALAIFARNYGAVVRGFPDLLSALFAVTTDVEAKVECLKTLYSEMGYGDTSKVHWMLLDQFFTELSAKLGAPGRLSWAQVEKELPLLPGTRRILSEEKELYGNQDPRIAVGAQLAQEWQAYTMTRQLYEGARNYVRFWSDRDQFHEACEYFYAHIGAAEKEHKQESMRAVMKYAVDDASVERISHGFHRLLDLYAGFWDGLARAISSQTGRTADTGAAA